MKIILHIVRKEFRQFRRDPKMFALILVAPVLQLIFLGYAVNMDVENVHTAILDFDKSVESRKLIEKIGSSDYFSIENYSENYDEIQALIDNGKITVGVVIPRGFQKGIMRGRQSPLQLLFDGSDGNSALIASGYILGIINAYSQKILVQRALISGRKLSASNLNAETRVWYNPDLKTRNYMVPGIVGLLLMIITLLLTSLAVVKETEIGTMEQLIVTPIKPYQLVLGKLIPFTILGFVVVVVVLTAMNYIFDISVRGSIFLLFFSSFLFILSTLGLGLFISTISKTQQQAMMLAIFVVMMPMIFLSGFAFPIENMPDAIQLITHIIPLKYFMIAIRGIILKGAGWAELWKEILFLSVIGFVILLLSSLRFRKRLD